MVDDAPAGGRPAAADHDRRPDPPGHGRAGPARRGLRRRGRDPARRDPDAHDGPPARIRHRHGPGPAHPAPRVRQPAAHRARPRRHGRDGRSPHLLILAAGHRADHDPGRRHRPHLRPVPARRSRGEGNDRRRGGSEPGRHPGLLAVGAVRDPERSRSSSATSSTMPSAPPSRGRGMPRRATGRGAGAQLRAGTPRGRHGHRRRHRRRGGGEDLRRGILDLDGRLGAGFRNRTHDRDRHRGRSRTRHRTRAQPPSRGEGRGSGVAHRRPRPGPRRGELRHAPARGPRRPPAGDDSSARDPAGDGDATADDNDFPANPRRDDGQRSRAR
jgi:hypothetical protein